MFRHADVACLCLVCIMGQFSMHELQFVITGRGCNRRPYGRGIHQSWSHDCLIGSMSVSFCLPYPVAVSACIICSGLCASTEMLSICVLYVSFGSKVVPRTFGCVAMGSAVLFILRSILLLYYAVSGVNRVQVVLSEFSVTLFCFVQVKTVCISCLHSCLCVKM